MVRDPNHLCLVHSETIGMFTTKTMPQRSWSLGVNRSRLHTSTTSKLEDAVFVQLGLFTRHDWIAIYSGMIEWFRSVLCFPL